MQQDFAACVTFQLLFYIVKSCQSAAVPLYHEGSECRTCIKAEQVIVLSVVKRLECNYMRCGTRILI